MSDHTEFGLSSREKSPHREPANKHSKGARRYRDRIEKDSRTGRDLPFKFSKPKRPERRSVICECPVCESSVSVTKNTVIVVCSGCRSLFDVNEDTIISS